MVQVLRDMAENERRFNCSHQEPTPDRNPNYAQLYEYISEIMCFNRVPRNLDEADAAALLDMIIW